MPNYQNGKIYKLICSKTNRVYIGSTTTKLKYRKSQHTKSDNTCCSKDFINPEIYLIEDYPCNSKLELHSKEREYVENNDCVNRNIPCRTRKEWREANKVYKKEYNKEYHENNKERKKEYYENNKEKIKERTKEKIICKCGGKFTRGNKSYHLKTKKHQIFTIKNLI